MAEDFTAKFKVDISDLKKNISEATNQIKLANAQFAANTSGMDKWSDNADGLAAKLKQLKSTLEAQKSILQSYNDSMTRNQKAYEENGRRAEELKRKLQELSDQGVSRTDEQYKKYEDSLKKVLREQDNNAKSVDDLKLKILEQEAAVGKTEKEIRHYTEAEENLGKESKDTSKDVDELSDETKKAGDNAKKSSEGFTVFKGVLADLAASAIKATLNGLKKLGSAFVDLTKQSVEEYGKLEQLRGSMETTFGSDMQKVLDNANRAFQTTGLSANQYMQSITGMAALMVTALGGDTKAAADLADQAMQDMADNANTFHTDLSSVEQAYEGFAKGRFTNLAKLNLGYASSKEEMERLITDAEKLDDTFQAERDSTGKLTMNFADIVKAINTVQKSMGMAGATAKQSSDTIEGSIQATQAAWQNLITAMGDPSANISEVAGGLVKSLKNVIKNIAPVVQQAVSAFPDIVEMIIEALEEQGFVDQLIDLANDLLTILMQKLPGMLQKLSRKLIQILPGLVKSLTGALPGIVKTLTTIITDLVGHLTEFIQPLLDALPDVIKAILGALPDVIRSLMTELPKIINALLEALPDIIDALIDALPEIVSAIIDELPNMLLGIGKAIVTNFPKIIESVGQGLADLAVALWDWCVDMGTKLGEWLGEVFAPLVDWASNAWETGKQFITDLWKGISDSAQWLWNQITGFLGDTWNKILDFFGISHEDYNTHFGSSGRKHGGGVLDGADSLVGGSVAGAIRGMDGLSGSLAYSQAPLGRQGAITFNQTINSPKALSRQDVYRNTQQLIEFADFRASVAASGGGF